ncbi:hypothetical protein B1H18_31500 [Streptomyces tsukubensis]|uniref:Uncharacterized protein n=1 Tax=Streptomyces tsukubensis TaxID=83656 RepID=A0A1V3ZZS2_9ACTN|nr:hypothetical protein B1H18_31500 [Streptomyces tsukubensis]
MVPRGEPVESTAEFLRIGYAGCACLWTGLFPCNHRRYPEVIRSMRAKLGCEAEMAGDICGEARA